MNILSFWIYYKIIEIYNTNNNKQLTFISMAAP